MEILKNAGTHQILHLPQNPIQSIADAARTCYQSQEKASPESDKKLVKNLLKRGHEAMIEFANMTVQFNNVCRGFTHELVRHRLASLAQESTRYVDESDFKVVVPPHMNENEPLVDLDLGDGTYLKGISLKKWFQLNEQMYRGLRDCNWAAQDARQVLPIAIKSQIVISANLREWRHIFKMRTSKFAHWEIRGVMCNLLADIKNLVPVIFDDFKDGFDDITGLSYYRQMPDTSSVW